MTDSESAVSNSPAPPASPPGGQEDEGQPGAFTPLTDSQGRELCELLTRLQTGAFVFKMFNVRVKEG